MPVTVLDSEGTVLDTVDAEGQPVAAHVVLAEPAVEQKASPVLDE